MICTHGDDQIRCVQELRGHPALSAKGGVHSPLHQIGVDVGMHRLGEALGSPGVKAC